MTVDALMRTRVIEVTNVRGDLASQMAFTHDHDVIQQFSPDAANEALAHCIRFGHSKRCLDHLDAGSGCHTFEAVAILAIIVADEKTRSFTKRRGFAKLLGLSTHHSVSV